jgi:NADH dehydrogenase
VQPGAAGGGGERVLVAGATGYLGRRLVPRLRATGRIVRALVRGGAARAAAFPHLAGCEIADGEVTDGPACRRAAQGADAIVNLVGLIRERGKATFEAVHVGGTSALVEAGLGAGVRRFLYVSALGARPDAPTAYARTKAEAERRVRESGLDWIVLRPSIVFARDGEFYGILDDLTATPLVPVLGPGRARLSPVHADDLAEIEAAAFDHPAAWNRAYEVCGPEAIPFVDLLRRVARGRGRRIALVHVPLWLARPAVRMMAALLPDPPITPEQLVMLEEGSSCDPGPAERAFGVRMRPVNDILGDGAAAAAAGAA